MANARYLPVALTFAFQVALTILLLIRLLNFVKMNNLTTKPAWTGDKKFVAFCRVADDRLLDRHAADLPLASPEAAVGAV